MRKQDNSHHDPRESFTGFGEAVKKNKNTTTSKRSRQHQLQHCAMADRNGKKSHIIHQMYNYDGMCGFAPFVYFSNSPVQRCFHMKIIIQMTKKKMGLQFWSTAITLQAKLSSNLQVRMTLNFSRTSLPVPKSRTL